MPRPAIIWTRSRELSVNVRYHLMHRMMISWSKCRPLKRSCAEVGSVISAVTAGSRAFQVCTRTFWQTYEKSATKFERLNRKFFEVIAEKPATIFIILRETISGEMIAFMLCFDMGERLINMFIGMDYSRPKEWMLFFRLWEAAVDLALSRGFSAILSGRSSYEAKIETGHRLVPLNNYCRHRNMFLNAIYRIVAQRISWASLDEALARFLKAHPESSH